VATKTTSESAAPRHGHTLVIKREFDAPRDLVFRAWTEPRHLIHWYGPAGFTVTHAERDARPGGAWRSCMRSPEGADHWVGGVYREVVPPERLVFTHVWESPGHAIGHETICTVELSDAGTRRTAMVFRQDHIESEASRDGHAGGWGGAFDRLEALAKSLA
jgi:uncharacterized protein YndB with AHSA1/START domain